MQTMHVGLVQMRCEKGAVDENLATIAAFLREGVRRGVDILCFPEMSITGYIDPTRQPEAVLQLATTHDWSEQVLYAPLKIVA